MGNGGFGGSEPLFLFCFKDKVTGRDGDISSSVHSHKWPKWLVVTQAEAKAWDSVQVSHMGDGPKEGLGPFSATFPMKVY